ncbi:MAG TPA: glycoside hydrolase family 3 N-terminal domain-containing protein [Actinospica sp.]|nr:glycoside hydrolase family 3 N-terminal domain-containing protein [Actinospica sp.]
MKADRALFQLAYTVLQPGFEGTAAPDWVRRRLADGLGSVLLFARNIEGPGQTAALTAQLRAENADVVVAADEEGGDVTRLDAATGSAYPGNLALGAVDDPELTSRVACALGRRLAAAGIGLDYAPDVDVNSNPDNPVIGVRSFGADPALVARHAAAWVRGLQSAGVGACAKHFPGHGDTSIDSHFALPTVRLSLRDLAEVTLPPFQAAIDAGARAVMLAHLLLPALDPDAPATVSPHAVRLLREELGFRGLIVTDAMEMRAVKDRYGLERAVVLAVAAGADLVCIGHRGDAEIFDRLVAALVDAVRTGKLAERRLAAAAAAVQRYAAWSRRALADANSGPVPGPDSSPAPDLDPDHPDPRPVPDRTEEQGVGLEAARRALSVTVSAAGALPLRSAPHVVAFTVNGSAALGSVAETSLGARLADALSGTTRAVLGECGAAAVDRVLRDAAGRPLVLAVRSAHRHPWMREALDLLLRARPDAIVAELGLPGTGPLGAAYLVAHGASAVCAQAVAEALTNP